MKLRFLWMVGSVTAWSISPAFADTTRYEHTSKMSPSDYLLQSRDQHSDSVFDQYKTVDLGLSVGVGSDCGRINFTSTLQASLKNILDTKYFGEVGKDILAGSPMLLTCYFSPTWCAILKHSQVNANFMSQMRLNQCALMDKYVDSRVEDYYQERQKCVRKSIDNSRGDLESSMDSCSGNNMWRADLANWAGGKNGETVGTNKLIESSAQWAGFNGDDSRRTLDLVKSMVGDTIVSRGGVSIQYGPRQSALTPRTYLQSLERFTHEALCQKIVKKVETAGMGTSLDLVVSEDDLRKVSPNTEELLVDRQTIRALAYMSPRQRSVACQKLSDAVAMTVFSTDVSRSLDMLTTLAQNPNLPENRKQEIERKRKALKDSVEMSVTLQKQRNDPLNNVLSQINQEGQRLQSESVRQDLSTDAASQDNFRVQKGFMNCADGIMCEQP